MPLQATISKISRHPIKVAALFLTIASILFLVFSTAQFARFQVLFPVEWANEASSVQLQFDKKNPYSGRFIIVSHTAVGKKMATAYFDYYKKTYPGIVIENHALYSTMAASPAWLEEYKYLDFFTVVKLELAHYWQTLWFKNFTHAQILHPNATGTAVLEPIFTRGLNAQPDNTLVNKLRLLTQQATPGSDISFSVFLFYYENPDEPLLLDLLAAAERGVNVQLITDLPEADNPENRGAGQAFQDAFKKRLLDAAAKGHSDSWLNEHGAVNWFSKNHTKIFLFSNSAGQKNCVVLSSENLTDREREKYQAGLIIRDKKSYDDFKAYWGQILQGSYKNQWVSSNNANLTHYFFPQTSGDDAVYKLLDNILINKADPLPAKIKISMARWNFERFPVAMKLQQLAESGVRVEVITRNNPQIVDDIILDALRHSPNIILHTADVARLNIHSKYILFDGYYRDANPDTNSARKKILWVGSHNFTGMAMRNNYETWSEVRDEKVFQDFSANFLELTQLVPVESTTQ